MAELELRRTVVEVTFDLELTTPVVDVCDEVSREVVWGRRFSDDVLVESRLLPLGGVLWPTDPKLVLLLVAVLDDSLV